VTGITGCDRGEKRGEGAAYPLQRGVHWAPPLTLKGEEMLTRSRGFGWWSLLLLVGALAAATACTGQATEPVEEANCTLIPGPHGPADDPACVTVN
jgi:hypothetical protein